MGHTLPWTGQALLAHQAAAGLAAAPLCQAATTCTPHHGGLLASHRHQDAAAASAGQVLMVRGDRRGSATLLLTFDCWSIPPKIQTGVNKVV